MARLIAYVATLALLFILGLYMWDQLPEMHPAEASARPAWTLATRSTPAFASNQTDFIYKTKAYQIFRHAEGGRKDVLRWVAENGRPVAALEIYRAGGETEPAMKAAGHAAGVIDSKFGPIMLLRSSENSERACLHFIRTVDQPALQMSGFVCQGETVPARAAAVACMLNRLTLMAAGNDARLAELFAHAELKRAECRTDWVSGSDRPSLRGAI